MSDRIGTTVPAADSGTSPVQTIPGSPEFAEQRHLIESTLADAHMYHDMGFVEAAGRQLDRAMGLILRLRSQRLTREAAGSLS
jgi:hypothetical protein